MVAPTVLWPVLAQQGEWRQLQRFAATVGHPSIHHRGGGGDQTWKAPAPLDSAIFRTAADHRRRSGSLR